jgi:hypothetical protein
MGVSRSGFYAWLNQSPSARSRSDKAVGQQVKALPAGPAAHGASGETFWQTASNAICTGSNG